MTVNCNTSFLHLKLVSKYSEIHSNQIDTLLRPSTKISRFSVAVSAPEDRIKRGCKQKIMKI